MRRIEIRVLSSSELCGLDTDTAYRVHAVWLSSEGPGQRPMMDRQPLDADGVKFVGPARWDLSGRQGRMA
jgi:hypothetical protein